MDFTKIAAIKIVILKRRLKALLHNSTTKLSLQANTAIKYKAMHSKLHNLKSHFELIQWLQSHFQLELLADMI